MELFIIFVICSICSYVSYCIGLYIGMKKGAEIAKKVFREFFNK